MLDQEVVDELNARADAGQKMGMVAIEMVVSLAAALGKRVDVGSYAADMETADVIDGLNAGDFKIEAAARKRVATILRKMAATIESRGL